MSDALPVTITKLPGDIRVAKFSDDRINAAVEHQLGKVPSDAKVAFVATAFKEGNTLTTKVAIYVNKGSWSFGGFVEGDQHRPLDKVGAELRFVH